MIKRQGSRTSFESVVSREPQPPPGLPAVHSRPMSVMDPWHEWHETSGHEPVHDDRGFEDLAPFSANERIMLDALHAQNDGPQLVVVVEFVR